MSTDPLGPEWGFDPDGTRTRSASRVVLVDEAGRVLLLRGTDPTAPGVQWWFTVGGGRAADEDPAAAAARELLEETGIVVDPTDLDGPVWSRVAEFDFLGSPCRQAEEFFVLRVDGAVELSRDGWTDLENESVSEVRWWNPADLAASGETFYPQSLPELLAGLPDRWSGPPRAIG